MLFRSLERGAPFLFDLNREEAYVLYWNNSDSIVEENSVCVMRSAFNEETKIGRYDVTAFECVGSQSIGAKSSRWLRKDFTLRQTFHDLGAVHKALLKAGFKDITMYDARDMGMKGDAGYGRTFFLCVA